MTDILNSNPVHRRLALAVVLLPLLLGGCQEDSVNNIFTNPFGSRKSSMSWR